MKKTIAILAALSLAAFAGQMAIDLTPVAGSDYDWLQYDDGTAAWLTWGGMYRGVWFNIEDFFPGATSYYMDASQFWFYHHSSYPWDTSDVYLEIWNGDAMGPTNQLDQTMVTAVHYTPIYAEYSTTLTTEGNFWALANTELSAGGWPSILGDGTAGVHSFFSDDFIVWEPWGEMGDYFIRVVYYWALDNSTWGSLKATF
ncbi:MAG: hypothetical protein K8S62_13555 [Candidatus Sabulitectum sp.]|nr:hypothetical protein [Candidatus Sabulitectum sp.]